MSNSLIRDSINSIVANKTQNNIFICEVDSYDESTNTISVSSISTEHILKISDVRLNPNICDGFTLIPSINSIVFVMKNITDNKYYCLSTSDIDGIYIHSKDFLGIDTDTITITGTQSINIQSNQITFNGGQNKGLVKITELVDKINNLENLLNDLISKYNGHTHLYIPGTLAPIPSNTTLSLETSTLTPTQISDLENNKILH